MDYSKAEIHTVNYLRNSPIYEYKSLVQWICNENYTYINGKIPTVRYRGTSITKIDSGYVITGWNRNVGQLSKMIFSFPCIIKAVVDNTGIIEGIKIDEHFLGSKGPLCKRNVLEATANDLLAGKNITDFHEEGISIQELKCFHVFEVIAAAGSAFSIMKNNNMDSFYEEELLEGFYSENIFHMMEKQNFPDLNKSFSYRFDLHNLKDSIEIIEDGTIVFKEPVKADFVLNGNHIFDYMLQGNSKNRVFVSLACMAKKALKIIKAEYFEGEKDFFCTSLRPDSFIGAYFLSVPLDLNITDLQTFQKSMNVLRIDSHGPKCIGGVN